MAAAAAASPAAAPRVLTVDPAALAAVSLDWAAPLVSWSANARYFAQPSGEHYRLLASLASQLRGARICDVGTYLGFSALALAHGAAEAGNEVTTWDVADCLAPPPARTVREVPHLVRRVLRDAAEDLDEIARADLVLIDVDPHDGVQERAMVEGLAARGFRGVLVLDDVRLNDAMKAMWDWVPAARKLDLTEQGGHWSGTGVAVFDPSWLDVRVVAAPPPAPTGPGGVGAGGKLL